MGTIVTSVVVKTAMDMLHSHCFFEFEQCMFNWKRTNDMANDHNMNPESHCKLGMHSYIFGTDVN